MRLYSGKRISLIISQTQTCLVSFYSHVLLYTVNVEIFRLSKFLRVSRFLDMRENIYNVKNIFIKAQRAKNTKSADFNASEIAHFVKSAKIHTRGNILC